MRRLLHFVLSGVLATAALLFGPALSAIAHPLGNFTISHHVGLHIQPDFTELELILDFAEIPTFQIKRQVTDAAALDDSQAEDLALETCDSLVSSLEVTHDQMRLALSPMSQGIDFFPGEGDLETMRLTCRFEFATPDTFPGVVEVVDSTYKERIGWREIVISSAGVDIETMALASSPTSDLRSYPAEAATSPRNDRSAVVTLIGPGPGTGPDTVGGTVQSPPSRSLVDRLGQRLSPDRLAQTPVLAAVLLALALGFAHAVAPGHGKTLVAAYLVGNKGTWRHAAALGMTVAVSHTIGVAALGAVTYAASSAFSPERVYPYLATLSGLIVLGLGVFLVMKAWSRRNASQSHGEHGGRHSHGGPPDGHSDHNHDLHHGHTHTIPTDITWKGLAALGISGGLVPSASAVVLLLGAVGLGRVGLGLVLVLAFGLGMAAALVGAGLLVVGAERLGTATFGGNVLIAGARRVMPTVMAMAVLLVGIYLTANGAQTLIQS